MVTTDPYEDGAQETSQDFTTNDFRITRVLDSLLISAKSITGDKVVAEDIAAADELELLSCLPSEWNRLWELSFPPHQKM
jgi:hypothetical protein